MKAFRITAVCLLCLGPGVFPSPGVRAATTEEPADVPEQASPTDEPAESIDLDKLLDMADTDVGQLSQVRVSGLTGSESLDMPVSTVSRQESTVGQSAAAIFVITNEMICYRPNCHRTFDRIMTVWIWGAKTRLYRIVENFGEDGAGSPDLIAVVVSAVSVGRTDRFRRSVREVCYSNGNDRIGWLGVGRGVLPAVAP